MIVLYREITINFCQFLIYFTKVFLWTLMLGLQEHNIRQNLRKIVVHIKCHISVLLTITTFLLSLLLSLKTGCFFVDFFSLSNDSCYWYVMTNTSIR